MSNLAITGQYECQHSPGIGLNYFTARLDRLILRADGRFTLIIQKQSRAVGAAQSWLKGEQASAEAQEARREGNYTQQDRQVMLRFDDGGYEEAQVSWNGDGIQIGPNFFTKVSSSTLLPPTHRLKQDMEDIAKGVKIASTLGGFALKAAKTLQGVVQPEADSDGEVPPAAQLPTPAPARPVAPPSASPVSPPAPQPVPAAPSPMPSATPAVVFCDQCGARARPGKRFCNNCGAHLL